MNLLCRLRGHQSATMSKFAKALRATGLTNIFNPSFENWQSLWYIAFRAIANAGGPIRSYLLVYEEMGQQTRLIDLTERYAQDGIASVADPKLFCFNDELWLTFNTGWHPAQNELYIARLVPELGAPLRCAYSGRQAIEKNWAFYGSGDSLYAIYALQGGCVLKAVSVFSSTREVEFTPVGKVLERTNGEHYSIGTQLAWDGDKALLIAHRKIHCLGRRLYLGRFVKIDFDDNDVYAEIRGGYLLHSFRALLGSRVKHNKNLLSCSYFSGLRITPDGVQVGYGINDVDFAFADIGKKAIW